MLIFLFLFLRQLCLRFIFTMNPSLWLLATPLYSNNLTPITPQTYGTEEEVEIVGMMKTIFIKHSERSSVPKRSKESYRKVRSNGREPRTDNVRESTMTFTCHNCRNPWHKRTIAKS